MILFTCKCPRCDFSDFSIDIEKTLEYYDELFELSSSPVHLLNENPPIKPEEFVMVCENPDCGHHEKWKLDRLIHQLRDSLSSYAWANRKKYRPENLFNLEDVLVQYFHNNETIEECALQNNAYLRRLYHKARGTK